MKQNIKTVIITLLLLALLPGTLLIASMTMPCYYQDSYYAVLPQMYQRLRETQGPKIVVVGGSNVAFGLDTALMEQLLGEKGYDYTVCSFGLYAAVGSSAMLDLSQDTLREGDIVVLAFEPTSETMSTYFGATAFWKCAECAPELILGVSPSKRDTLFGNFITYVQERYSIFTSGILPQVEGVYARASFNQRCDMIYHRAGNAMPLGYDSAAPVDLAGVRIGADFAEQVNDYCRAAREAGAQVFLSFSPVNATALVGGRQAAVQSFFELCNTTFDCPVISDPDDYILDSGWFYDSNFHLNSAGAVLRTCMLAEDILAQIGCYEGITYELPQMPPSIATVQGSTAETDLFTYAPITNDQGQTVGYRISGLKNAGLTKTELTVPGSYKGKPVVGFTDDALAGATALTQLRLPESIESLGDGLFRNCAALTRLILEHQKQTCAVTEHTFDGADQIMIFVPAESYAMYRDGTGCETNPWDQYLDRIHQIH